MHSVKGSGLSACSMVDVRKWEGQRGAPITGSDLSRSIPFPKGLTIHP